MQILRREVQRGTGDCISSKLCPVMLQVPAHGPPLSGKGPTRAGSSEQRRLPSDPFLVTHHLPTSFTRPSFALWKEELVLQLCKVQSFPAGTAFMKWQVQDILLVTGLTRLSEIPPITKLSTNTT